jgi:outer membrane protein OmpA-like peptidoglycan-associated protein
MVAIYGDSTILVLHRVLFSEGSTRLAPDQRAALDEVVELLRKVPMNPATDRPLLIEIEGHADSSEKGAQRLAKRRAEAVRDALVKLGVAKDKLSVSAHAAERPLVPSDSSENRQLNRRVSFQLGSQR